MFSKQTLCFPDPPALMRGIPRPGNCYNHNVALLFFKTISLGEGTLFILPTRPPWGNKHACEMCEACVPFLCEWVDE